MGILRTDLQSGYYLEDSIWDSIIMILDHVLRGPTLGGLYRFGGPRALLASLSETRVLVTRETNQVWASLHPSA